MFLSRERYRDLVKEYCDLHVISLIEFACLAGLSEVTVEKYRKWETDSTGYLRKPKWTTEQKIKAVLKIKNPHDLLLKIEVPKPRLVCTAREDTDITLIVKVLASEYDTVLFADFVSMMKEAAERKRVESSVVSLTGQLACTDVTELVQTLAAKKQPITLKDLLAAYAQTQDVKK